MKQFSLIYSICPYQQYLISLTQCTISLSHLLFSSPSELLSMSTLPLFSISPCILLPPITFLPVTTPILPLLPKFIPQPFYFLFHLRSLARIIWTTLSLTAFSLSIHFLLKHFSLKVQVFVALFALQLFPVKFALAQGQINFFVFLGFILLYQLLIQKKDFWTGLTLSAIIITKLSPILLLLYLLILKKYRLIAYCLASLILLNLAIDLSTSHNLSLSFLQGTLFRSTNPPLDYYNQSLPALLYRLNLSSISNSIGLFFLSVTSISFLKNPTQTKKHFTLFLLSILLISPITWQHYLFWSIPAFFYLLLDSQKYSLPLIFLALILININIKNPTPYIYNQLIFSHATVGLLLLYFLILKSKPKSV